MDMKPALAASGVLPVSDRNKTNADRPSVDFTVFLPDPNSDSACPGLTKKATIGVTPVFSLHSHGSKIDRTGDVCGMKLTKKLNVNNLTDNCTSFCRNVFHTKPCSLQQWRTDRGSFYMPLDHPFLTEFKEVLVEVNMIHITVAAITKECKIFVPVSLAGDNIFLDKRQESCAKALLKKSDLFVRMSRLQNRIALQMDNFVMSRPSCSKNGKNTLNSPYEERLSGSSQLSGNMCMYTCGLCRVAMGTVVTSTCYYYFFYLWEFLNFRLGQLILWKEEFAANKSPEHNPTMTLPNGKKYKWDEMILEIDEAVYDAYGLMYQFRSKLDRYSEIATKEHENFIGYAKLIIRVFNTLDIHESDTSTKPSHSERQSRESLTFPDLKKYETVIGHRIVSSRHGQITSLKTAVELIEPPKRNYVKPRKRAGQAITYILQLMEELNQLHLYVPQRLNIGCEDLLSSFLPATKTSEIYSVNVIDDHLHLKVCHPAGEPSVFTVKTSGIYDIDLLVEGKGSIPRSSAIMNAGNGSLRLICVDEAKIIDGTLTCVSKQPATESTISSVMCSCDWFMYMDVAMSSQYRTAAMQNPYIYECFQKLESLTQFLEKVSKAAEQGSRSVSLDDVNVQLRFAGATDQTSGATSPEEGTYLNRNETDTESEGGT